MADLFLLSALFPGVDKETLKTLSEDPSFISQLPNLIKQRIDAGHQVVPMNPEYYLILFSGAGFADDEERIYLSTRLRDYFHFEGSFLPLAVDYLKEFEQAKSQGSERVRKVSEDFGSRCLFSLSFFRPALQRLYNRGAPNPEFYRAMGKRAFTQVGAENVVRNFDDWEVYLQKQFANIH